MDTESITLREAAKQLETTTRTLRRYCEKGYIPHLRRDQNSGYYILNPWQRDLLRILVNMKQCGFRTADLHRYAALAREGKATAPERKAMLTTRKRQLWQEIAARQTAIDFIERQEELFENY